MQTETSHSLFKS